MMMTDLIDCPKKGHVHRSHACLGKGIVRYHTAPPQKGYHCDLHCCRNNREESANNNTILRKFLSNDGGIVAWYWKWWFVWIDANRKESHRHKKDIIIT